MIPAQASTPTPATLCQLPGNASCTKATSNCVLYPKAAALPNGRLVAAFEKSTVTSSGSADGQTIPVYKSDDNGTTWQYLTDVKAPAYASSNPAYSKYVSNWTNPYLYVLPQAVGNLAAGTLLMATVVSGDHDERRPDQRRQVVGVGGEGLVAGARPSPPASGDFGHRFRFGQDGGDAPGPQFVEDTRIRGVVPHEGPALAQGWRGGTHQRPRSVCYR